MKPNFGENLEQHENLSRQVSPADFQNFSHNNMSFDARKFPQNPKKILSPVAINRQLMLAPTLQDLFHLVGVHIDNFDFVNMVTVIYRCAKGNPVNNKLKILIIIFWFGNYF